MRNDAKRLLAEGKSVRILAVGRKGADNLKRDLGNLITDRVSFQGLKSVGFEQASEVSGKIMAGFANGEFDVCTLYFSRFESVISQVPTGLQLIPAAIPEKEEGEEEDATSGAAYEYEPEEDVILDQLLRRNIGTQVFSWPS